MIPTRWRARLEDQLADAQERIVRARQHLDTGDGSGALQTGYQAVVSAGTLRVWLAARAWEATIDPEAMRLDVQAAFPNLFAALAAMDLQHALTSAWNVEAASPYVAEAEAFVSDVAAELQRCLNDS
jgi:hypothetical protein